MIMESCLEGLHGTFNVSFWELCHKSPQRGGFTVDQWLTMRDLRVIRGANQAEHSRVLYALNTNYPSCPRCSLRNKKSAFQCRECKYTLREADEG